MTQNWQQNQGVSRLSASILPEFRKLQRGWMDWGEFSPFTVIWPLEIWGLGNKWSGIPVVLAG
jgi:hypothetical protein